MYNYLNKRSQLNKSVSAGAISQISMENEIDILDMDSAVNLQHRLDELEQITMSFLCERPLALTTMNDAFADIDVGATQAFEIYIPEFTRNDVLCVDVICIPDTVDDPPGSDQQNLVVMLKTAPLGTDSNSPIRHINTCNTFVPSYHNGEYEFGLTSAHGMTPGRHILCVTNRGTLTQSVRTHMAVCPYVTAHPLQPGERFTRRGVKSEFTYFRYLRRDPSELISVRVTPLPGDSGGPITDPDLYISNKYAGLVRTNLDNHIWRSSKVGADQVDIHPRDDNAARGDTFVIGVHCHKDQVSNFEISLSSTAPAEHILISRGDGPREVVVRHDAYTYLSIPIDVTRKGKMVISVMPFTSACELPQGANDDDSSTIEQQFGRGVYTIDSLVSSGVFCQENGYRAEGSITLAEAIVSQLDTSEHHAVTAKGDVYDKLSPALSVPPSVAKTVGLFPVAFLSSSSMYPTAETATWQASSLTGDLLVHIESDEWKYAERAVCYMSLIGVHLPGQPAGATSTSCRISLDERLDVDDLSLHMRSRFKVYSDIFEGVDGSNISQVNRSQLPGDDQQALTYGEVEFLECLKILEVAGARDNQIFVDLGCGVAKTLVAAAFSGTKFVRCVGIEILPDLCEAARSVILKTKNTIGEIASGAQDSDLLSLASNFPLLEIWEGDASDDSSFGMASWTDADIVYVSSICFPDSLMQKLIDVGRSLKEGSVFITLKLPEHYSQWFTVSHRKWFKMSWGRVMVYFLRRNGVSNGAV